MGKERVEVTVTYTPIKDKNKDGYADKEKPVKTSNNEASPKTQDNIIKYVVFELIFLLAAVIIFIRIKAKYCFFLLKKLIIRWL